MSQRRQIALLLLGSGFLAEVAIAQAPQPAQSSSPAPRHASAMSGRPRASSPGSQSVVRRRTTPYWYGEGRASRYPEHYERMWDTYRTSAPYQNADAQVPVARFDAGGGAPDRNEQLEAERVGIQRANSVQQQLSEFSRPYGFGYGFGFGFR